jgi:Kef-type K+ transport system membrane component KefB
MKGPAGVSPASGALNLQSAAIYAALLLAAIALFFVIDGYGSRLERPSDVSVTTHATVPGGKPNALPHVLIALLAVLVMGRLLGIVFRYIGQPPVIGEVVGGILLGPSLLGRVWPAAAAFVLPPAIAPYLEVIAQVGVILYMFLVGLDLNPGELRQRARTAVAISHAGIVVPFLCGASLAMLLYPRFAGEGVPFKGFALFTGAAMSITAFPVLARILTDRQMHRTPIGMLALGCAATDDVTAWCLLAFVVGVARADASSGLVILGMTAIFIGFMFLIARPALARLSRRFPRVQPTPNVVALVFGALLLSALATEAIGIHALFGAFLLGAIIPRDAVVVRALARKVEDLVTVLLLPAFFALTGMRTRIDLVAGLD